MLAMLTPTIVSTWSDDGHLHATRHNEASVPIGGREAADCGRGIGRGASVAQVARAHGVNANLVFNWCRLYRAGRLGRRSEAKLLPVRVAEESSTVPPASWTEPGGVLTTAAGTIHIQLQHAQVRVESGANPVLLRVLLECLQR